MDFDKIISAILSSAQRIFSVACAIVLIMVALAGVYLTGRGLLWIIAQADTVLGGKGV